MLGETDCARRAMWMTSTHIHALVALLEATPWHGRRIVPKHMKLPCNRERRSDRDGRADSG